MATIDRLAVSTASARLAESWASGLVDLVGVMRSLNEFVDRMLRAVRCAGPSDKWVSGLHPAGYATNHASPIRRDRAVAKRRAGRGD
jgi:hypothetical protein